MGGFNVPTASIYDVSESRTSSQFWFRFPSHTFNRISYIRPCTQVKLKMKKMHLWLIPPTSCVRRGYSNYVVCCCCCLRVLGEEHAFVDGTMVFLWTGVRLGRIKPKQVENKPKRRSDTRAGCGIPRRLDPSRVPRYGTCQRDSSGQWQQGCGCTNAEKESQLPWFGIGLHPLADSVKILPNSCTRILPESAQQTLFFMAYVKTVISQPCAM